MGCPYSSNCSKPVVRLTLVRAHGRHSYPEPNNQGDNILSPDWCGHLLPPLFPFFSSTTNPNLISHHFARGQNRSEFPRPFNRDFLTGWLAYMIPVCCSENCPEYKRIHALMIRRCCLFNRSENPPMFL